MTSSTTKPASYVPPLLVVEYDPNAPIPADPYERVRLGVALRSKAPAIDYTTAAKAPSNRPAEQSTRVETNPVESN